MEILERIKIDAIQTCVALGLMVKLNEVHGHPCYNHAPVSLFPSPVPRAQMESIVAVQKDLLNVICCVIQDPTQNIELLLSNFAKHDLFMHKLMQVSKVYNSGGLRQDIHMCVLRSDYMLDQHSQQFKLVEYNTIACSFGCLSQKVKNLQEYIYDKYAQGLSFNYQLPQQQLSGDLNYLFQEPYIDRLVESFKYATDLYKQSVNIVDHNRPVYVLFVVEDKERNVIDQKVIEVELFRRYKIHSMRCSFGCIEKAAVIDPETGVLRILNQEVAFIYYRAGYDIDHYQDENGDTERYFKVREMLECSMAIKCPSVDFQLTGFKKYQQAFGDEVLLQRVLGECNIDSVKDHFKGIWSLEDFKTNADVQTIIQKAIENPHDYVMKPQKEGGGNNFFDEDIPKLLNKMLENPDEAGELLTYLIMERINPPSITFASLRAGNLLVQQGMSELGIFSHVFTKNNRANLTHEVLKSNLLGTLIRTKASHFNEGGVNAGFAVVDSPFIVDDEYDWKQPLSFVKL